MKSAALKQKALQQRDAGQRASAGRKWAVAIAAFERALALDPEDAQSWLFLAHARVHSGNTADALIAAERAFALDQGNVLSCRLLADIHSGAGRFAKAIEVYTALDPGSPRDHDFWAEYGNALWLARRHREAVDALMQALSLRIDSAIVHHRLGLAFRDLGMSGESAECFRTAIALDKGRIRTAALSLVLYDSRNACDWKNLEADTAALLTAIDTTDDSDGSLLAPFALIALDTTPAQQRRIGELRSRSITRDIKPLPPPQIGAARHAGRIRVGYLSADFSQHATSQLLVEFLERRDSTRFETFLYSHSIADGSALQQRVRAACEHFVDVNEMSNLAVAERMRSDELDIVIDLKGHTRDSRFELLAYRPAAVQAAWLGYPAATGANFIDYMIGDPIVLPLEHAPNYSEQIAQLPICYQPNDRNRPLPEATPRSELGLPEDAVVLCCFNQTYKISPFMLDIWAAILQAAPNTVLWILAWDRHVLVNLRREFDARGVAAERVIFAPKASPAQHLARLRAADLFLDTWPCNAHTTASEALWCGVPVLTVPGETFASRVAASLVTACGLADLACKDAESYAHLAVALASEAEIRQGLRAHLEQSRMELPLFDSERFTREFEALLQRMHERAQAGLPPAPLPAKN
ncbi:MAG: tetratricopeptide repeat protein [Sinobacteraceae bacterium]|nr:tetratricopeptide repeat protein [Nevskiaceae bacterium]